MSKLRCLFVVALLMLFFCSGGVFGSDLKKVSIELKWFHQFQFAGIYAAKEKGFYKAEGLDVTILERDKKSSPLKDVESGKVQFGISDSTIIRERLKGKKVVILAAIFQHSPLVILTLEKNKLLSPLELKGKRVMYQRNVDDAIIIGMFNEFGIDREEYEFVPHSFNDDALLRGEVDAMSAYLSNQPFIYKNKGIKINIIKPINYGLDFYGDMLFTSESYLKENKETALAFRRATIRGWDYALDHPGEVIHWIKKIYGSKKTEDALKYEYEVIKRMVSRNNIELGSVNKKRFEYIEKIYKKTETDLRNGSLKGIDYRSYIKTESDYRKAAIFFIAGIFFLIIVSSFLVLFNKRLKSKVGQRTKEIEIANKKLDQYVSIINDANILLRLDKKGIILSSSKLFDEIVGVDMSKHIGNDTLTSFSLLKLDDSQRKNFKKALRGDDKVKVGCKLLGKNNSQHQLEFTISPILNNKDEVEESIVVFKDITEIRHVKALSLTDGLTQVPNRFSLTKSLIKCINECDQNVSTLSVIIFDIDYFKKLNDTFGHNVGDIVLKEIAKILKGVPSKEAIGGRWGGEEFLVICPNIGLVGAELIAEKIREKICKIDVVEGVRVSASFGVTEIEPEDSLDELVERADKCLYQAKKAGRNQVRSFKG